MNTDDINFAYKVRHALNENLDHLPASTVDRLAAARTQAVARKKAQLPVQLAQRAPGRDVRAFFSFSLLGRAGAVIPLLALVAALSGVYQYQEEQHIAEIAELDAAVLSDELPLTAYLDHGFNEYLAQSGQ